ncbi:hypothetical protein ET532_024145 [Verminephrobacter sp. Larva24]|nr:hypothetical protein ET532_024145 [Verminephrobacter sp. Larva24]
MPPTSPFDRRPSTEAAMTTGLSAAVEQVLGPLETFLRFEEGPDPTGRRSVWRAALNESLPRQGQGAQAVLDVPRRSGAQADPAV